MAARTPTISKVSNDNFFLVDKINESLIVESKSARFRVVTNSELDSSK